MSSASEQEDTHVLIVTAMNELEGLRSIWGKIPFQLFHRIPVVDGNIVSGSGFWKGGSTDDSDDPFGIRRFGNRFFTFLVNLLWNAHLSDATYGLRAYRADHPLSYHDVILLVQAIRTREFIGFALPVTIECANHRTIGYPDSPIVHQWSSRELITQSQ